MFERTLSSLIKGLRSHRGKDEARYIATVLDEIRAEVRSGDMQIKGEAILKLTYLQMLGYSASQTAFHTLEVMASPSFHLKQIGYLAAAQSFDQDTDVLILATNMIKKDLQSGAPLDIAVALNGLAHIVTPELAQHLVPDITRMLTHTRPAIRKKAVLVLYSIICKHPDALEPSLDRFRDRLDDPDPSVVAATVNVICELVRREPRPFLFMAPHFFRLLTTSSNNWMLIKLLKLFAALTPCEPRLVRKLLPPIRQIIDTTPAMSLLYECVHTLIVGDMLSAHPQGEEAGEELARTCIAKLSGFLEDEDQNLRYISLVALAKILRQRPALVDDHHQEMVLASLEDADLSIRLRALEIVRVMASSDNLVLIFERLLGHLEAPLTATSSATKGGGASQAAESLRRVLGGAGDAAIASQLSDSQAEAAVASASLLANPLAAQPYRLELVRTLLALARHQTYARVSDFEWFVDSLLRLARCAKVHATSAQVGVAIRDQLIDVCSRVRAVRPFAADRLQTQVLEDAAFLDGATGDVAEVVHAAAWVIGEYAIETGIEARRRAIPYLLGDRVAGACSASTVCACLHNALKVFALWTASLSHDAGSDPDSTADDDKAARSSMRDVVRRVRDGAAAVNASLEKLARSEDAEVQQRAVEFMQLLLLLRKDTEAYETRMGQTGAAATSASPQKTSTTDASPVVAPDNETRTTAAASPPPRSLNLLSPLFVSHVLGPVAKRAQEKVAVPPSLDLHRPIIAPGMYVLAERSLLVASLDGGVGARVGPSSKVVEGVRIGDESRAERARTAEDRSGEEKERLRAAKAERLRRQAEDPYYLPSSGKAKAPATRRPPAQQGKQRGTGTAPAEEDDDIDSIPIVKLSLDQLPSLASHASPPLPPPPIGVAGSARRAGVVRRELEEEEMPGGGTRAQMEGLDEPDKEAHFGTAKKVVASRARRSTSGAARGRDRTRARDGHGDDGDSDHEEDEQGRDASQGVTTKPRGSSAQRRKGVAVDEEMVA